MKYLTLIALALVLAGCTESTYKSSARVKIEPKQPEPEQLPLSSVDQPSSEPAAETPTETPADSDATEVVFGKTIKSNWSGKVTRVIDGDTIEVLQDKTPIRVRLESIDCPETKQPFSEKAKMFASDFCFGKDVIVLETGQDRYGRKLAFIKLVDGGTELSSSLLDAGLAWHYKKYSSDVSLAKIEELAKAAKRGLWAGEGPDDQIPPWEWRKR